MQELQVHLNRKVLVFFTKEDKETENKAFCNFIAHNKCNVLLFTTSFPYKILQSKSKSQTQMILLSKSESIQK